MFVLVPLDGRARAEVPELEEMIAAAMQNNAEIEVAEAKLREAQAELNRVRLQVAKEVIDFRSTWQAQRLALEETKERLPSLREQYKAVSAVYEAGEMGQDQVFAAKRALDEAERAIYREQTKLEEMEAAAPYLLGKQPVAGAAGSKSDTTDRRPSRREPLDPSMAEKMQKVLEKPTALDFVDFPLADVVNGFLQEFWKVNILIDHRGLEREGILADEELVTLQLAEAPAWTAIQALEDLYPPIRFVVRDYGLLLTSRGHEPEGAVSVVDFWKSASGHDTPEEQAEPAPDRR